MALPGKPPLNLVLGAGNVSFLTSIEPLFLCIPILTCTVYVGDKSVDPTARFDTPDEVNAYFSAFAARGYHQIDTARLYSPMAPGSSEPRIGAIKVGNRYILDTKVKSGHPRCHTKEKVLEEIDLSLEALKIKQINTEYLHLPDRETPFEEACEAMDQAHREGKIKHWGLSNYAAEEVQRIIDICEERSSVKPSVYQGHYNPIVRSGEKCLFPLLRKHRIAFYAYSPAAAGFFAGNHKKLKAGGRFDPSHMIGAMYSGNYLKPAIMEATDKTLEVAARHGIGGHAAALRWSAWHGILRKEYGDSIIIGSSSIAQLESNIDTIEAGPLPEDVVAALEALYHEIGDEVPYHL